jgi:hypothetical protein
MVVLIVNAGLPGSDTTARTEAIVTLTWFAMMAAAAIGAVVASGPGRAANSRLQAVTTLVGAQKWARQINKRGGLAG